jgi:hypothetical protein
MFNDIEPICWRQPLACRHHVGTASKIDRSKASTNESSSTLGMGTNPDRGLARLVAGSAAKRPVSSIPIFGLAA